MNLEKDLKNLRTLEHSAESAKEKLHCQVDAIVKKHIDNTPYRIDFNASMLMIRFKTRQLNPTIAYEINKELGCEGSLVPRQGYYAIQLSYIAKEEL